MALPPTQRRVEGTEIAFRELWGEPFVAAPPETAAWRDHWQAADGREGLPVRVGAGTEQPDDWLGAIAGGDRGLGTGRRTEPVVRDYVRNSVRDSVRCRPDLASTP